MKNKAIFLAYLEGLLSIFVNLLLFGLKYWAGIVTGSVAIIADAWHTLSDSLTSIVVLIGTKVSTKPADRGHPFGHGRAELVASIIIGVLLAIVGFNFIVEGVTRLSHHKRAAFGTLAVVIMVISIIMKEGIAQFSFWAARKAASPVLKADGWHHRSDAVTSIIILVGLFFGKYFWWIDGVLGIIVALFILYAAYDILKESINPLLGEDVDKKVVAKIKEISAPLVPGQLDIHHIHNHRYGKHVELTFHIILDGRMSLNEAHSIATAVEDAIRDKLQIETTIHVEPAES